MTPKLLEAASTLTFKDGTTRNVARVPPEQWQQHKDLLCSLYQDRTVAELMEVMKHEHGFVAK